MSLITRNAQEYRSMTVQNNKCHKIYLSGPFGVFCPPNHLVLAGTNNRNVIITYRFLAAPVLANRDSSGILTVYFSCKYFP